MQDKDLHIDKKFTDQAWSDMRRMLDVEMPVAERQRRFGWWWLMLGLAAFLGTGIAAVWYYSKKQPQQPVKVEQPVAFENSRLEKMEAVEPQLPATENTGKETKIESNSTASVSTNTAHQQAVLPKKAQLSQKANVQVLTKQENEFTTQIVDYQVANELLKTIGEDGEKLEKAEIAERQISRNLSQAEKIPSLELSFIDHQSTFDRNLDGQFSKKHSPIELLAYVGGLATPLNMANGADAGLSVGLQLGHGRFSLEGGPGYAFVQQPLYVVISQNADPVFNPSVTNTDEVFVSVSDAEKVASEASESLGSNITKVKESLQMHYANFPLSLKFRAAPRLNFHGGVNMGILLASSPGYTNGGVFKNASDSNLANEYNINADQLETSNIALSKFDLSATGGIGYQLNYRLGLDFQYKLGVRDLITSNSEKEYNRFFNLSLRYRILGKK